MGGELILHSPVSSWILTTTGRLRRFDAYLKAAEQVTFSQACLTRTDNADIEIDRVLTDCIVSVRCNFRVTARKVVF
jgi:TPP-dependent 2-oxoacid decarboxylase